MIVSWDGNGRAAEDPPGIARISAAPLADQAGAHTVGEARRWRAFVAWLAPMLKTGKPLAKRFSRAKVAQEESSARKTAAEACELAAKADESGAKAGVSRQEELGKFIANMKAITELPGAAQLFAVAKMIDLDPELLERVQEVKARLVKLKLTRGLTITPLLGPAAAAESTPEPAPAPPKRVRKKKTTP